MTSLFFKRDLAYAYSTHADGYRHMYTFLKILSFDIRYEHDGWEAMIRDSIDDCDELRVIMNYTLHRDLFAFSPRLRLGIINAFAMAFSYAVDDTVYDIIALLAPYCSARTFFQCIKSLCESNDSRATETLKLLIELCPEHHLDWNWVLYIACAGRYNHGAIRLAIERGATWCMNCCNEDHPEVPNDPTKVQI